MRHSGEGRVRCGLFTMAGALLAAGLLAGCTSTIQARQAKTSGFLGDYSKLRSGEGDEALLVYIKPKVDFKKYSKLMLDPVRIYAAGKSELAKVSKEDLQRLANYLDATLREQLKSDYAIVTEPGEGVLHLRVAITEAKGSKVVMDTFSTLMPIGLALSEVKNIAVGSHSAVGSVGVECEGLDAVSNVRLFAAVDERVGRKITGKLDKFDKWHTANDAFDHWAKRLQMRLSEERNRGAR